MKLDLPNIVCVIDYHEFANVEENVNALIEKGRIRVKEIGKGNLDRQHGYLGVVYAGRCPSKAVIDKLMKKKKAMLVDDYED